MPLYKNMTLVMCPALLVASKSHFRGIKNFSSLRLIWKLLQSRAYCDLGRAPRVGLTRLIFTNTESQRQEPFPGPPFSLSENKLILFVDYICMRMRTGCLLLNKVFNYEIFYLHIVISLEKLIYCFSGLLHGFDLLNLKYLELTLSFSLNYCYCLYLE